MALYDLTSTQNDREACRRAYEKQSDPTTRNWLRCELADIDAEVDSLRAEMSSQMTYLICADCERFRYGVRADGLFQCNGCGKVIAPEDIDLDGAEVWAVDEHGALGVFACEMEMTSHQMCFHGMQFGELGMTRATEMELGNRESGMSERPPTPSPRCCVCCFDLSQTGTS